MFEKTKSEPLKIETSFDDFFKDVIETIPIPPSYIEFKALAYDIPLCKMGKENIDLYLADCSKKRVLPFSKTGWTYDHSTNLFLFSGISFENLRNYIPMDTINPHKKIVNTISEGLLNRKKPHQLTIEIKAIDKMETGIKLFQKKNSSLLKNKYMIYQGTISFSEENHNQHHGPKNTGTIIFNRDDSKNILDLYLDENDNTPNNKKILDWFYILKEKYGTL